jgi:CBS-domain-containing membrane protein
MSFKKFIKKKRRIWHKHFIPSLIAAIVVAVIAFVYEGNVANIILFASVGASAVILTNTYSHHLTKLYTTVTAYIIGIIISIGVYYLDKLVNMPFSMNIFLLVFLVGIGLYLFDSFHPPAITASISFVLLEKPLFDLIYLFVAIIVLLIIIRVLMYLIFQNLSLKEFSKEFRKGFGEEIEKSF